MRDFELLVQNVHSRRMRLIIDFEMDHTSDQHPWFISSRSGSGIPVSELLCMVATDQQYLGGSRISGDRTQIQLAFR